MTETFGPASKRWPRCGTLRTIRDACDYMTGMGKQRELRSHWQRVCKLILANYPKAEIRARRGTKCNGSGLGWR
jgi:hypothetical protein